MKKRLRIFAVPVLVSLLWSAALEAAPPRVRFNGCVIRGHRPGCLMVRSGRALYNISAARPRPGVNNAVTGWGYLSAAGNFCHQGTLLRNVHWRPSPRLCAIVPPSHRPHRP
jgi:hypothetical protein